MVLTVVLAILFTALQAFEYVSAGFTITDSIFGSTFFMATGFHGFHVFIGTCFIAVCLVRL
jgi:heme/copper-type cytochrome/quinol oxidase subunit 3